MEASQKAKKRTAVWPSNAIPAYISKKQNTNSKRCMYAYVHSTIIYNYQDMEGNLSVHQQMNG